MLTAKHKQVLSAFAKKHAHWPKQELDAALWQVKWHIQALPHQREPETPYDTFLMLAGRGSGKTHTASHWLGIRAWKHPGTRWLASAPTHNDLRQVCFEGDSGLINIIPPVLIKDYNRTLSELTLVNGSIIQGIPASEPERYRGKQFHGAWLDELAAFEYLNDAYDQIQFTLRLKDGKIPRVQTIITTTPKPLELIVELAEGRVGGDVYVSKASSYDNKSNLSETFFKQLSQYEGTDLGRQEIYGDILDLENAGIIKKKWFRMYPASKTTPELEYVIVSVDPATSEKTFNDPTACTVWGIFEDDDKGTGILLLDAWRQWLAYPELRSKITNDYKEVVYGADNDFMKGRKADLILMEDKSAGISLIQELRMADIPVQAYNPGRADKVQRVNVVAPIVAKGKVWIPEDDKRKGEFAEWAKGFLRETTVFPAAGFGEGHDDYVDTLSQALRVLRDSGWISIDPLPPRIVDYADDPRKRFVNPYML